MRAARIIANLRISLLVLGCVPIELESTAPPNLSHIQKWTTKAEVENLLGRPVECKTLILGEQHCTYRYSYRTPVTTWVGPFPPYLPLFDPDFWRAQKRGELYVIYGAEDKIHGFSSGPDFPISQQWRSLCELGLSGDGAASSAVAYYFRNGWPHLEKDLVKAYLWYKLGSDQGHSEAAAKRKDLEYEMTSAEISEAAQASKNWKPDPKVCDLEETNSQLRISELAQSASQGDSNSAWRIYLLEKDPNEGWLWLCRAANAGNLKAQSTMGLYYRFGLGPSLKDRVRAHAWYSIAAANGSERSRKEMDALHGSLSSEELRESERLLERWPPQDCRTALDEFRSGNGTQASAS